MHTVVILCSMNLWSIAKGKGAPSFFNTVKGYQDAGWETILINTDSEESILENELTKIRHFRVEPYPKEQPDNKIGKWVYNNVRQAYFNRAFEQILESLLPTLDPKNSLLYAYEVGAVPAAKKMSEKYHMKLITRFQGTILCNKKHHLVNRIAYNHHYRALRTPSDLVIMTNDGTFGERVLKELGNSSPICFWRNGINRPPMSEGKDGGEKPTGEMLITISRLAGWKRVDRAISAMPEVLRKFPDCKLYIVGDGQEKENLIALANQLQLSEHVVFVGSVPQTQVYELLDRADIFLSLYDIGNVGNPLYEAMMCGKAIITLNNGDTASVISDGENGVLLEMSEAENCSQAIIALLSDPERKKKLETGAKKYADEHFWTWQERIQAELDTAKKLCETP